MRTVTLTNVSQTAVSVGSLALPAGPFGLTQDECSGQVVEPGAVCTVGVRLRPAADAVAGPVEASLSVPGGTAGNPHSVLLRGRVTVAGAGRPGPSRPSLRRTDDTGARRPTTSPAWARSR